MNKKLLISVLLCFFIFSMGSLAKEEGKAKTIEFLAREDLWSLDGLLYFEPSNIGERQGFNKVLLELQVPPSPKCDALFIFLDTKYGYAWGPVQSWNALGGIRISLTSPSVPEGILVRTWIAIVGKSETNNTYDTGNDMSPRNFRFMLKRDCISDALGWLVYYEETGEPVPENEAIHIINDLIDNGFNAEFLGYVWVQGMEWIKLDYITVEVTRLSKN